jgi:hypothetical protein
MNLHILVCLSLSIVGCSGGATDDTGAVGGGGPSGEVSACSACADTQVCIMEFSEEDTVRCEPIPEVCAGEANCFDVECQMAMYDYCPLETWAWGCSDTFPPTVISCNF